MLDFGISLKSITVNWKITKIGKSNAGNNGKILENAFENVIQISCVVYYFDMFIFVNKRYKTSRRQMYIHADFSRKQRK